MSWRAGKTVWPLPDDLSARKRFYLLFSDVTRQAPKRDTIVTTGPIVGHGLQCALTERIGEVDRPYQVVERVLGAYPCSHSKSKYYHGSGELSSPKNTEKYRGNAVFFGLKPGPSNSP